MKTQNTNSVNGKPFSNASTRQTNGQTPKLPEQTPAKAEDQSTKDGRSAEAEIQRPEQKPVTEPTTAAPVQESAPAQEPATEPTTELTTAAPAVAPAPIIQKSVTELLAEQKTRLQALNRTAGQIDRVSGMKTDLERLTVDEREERSISYITITDDMRREVKFTHPVLVQRIIDCMSTTIDEKLNELQSELLSVSLQ